MKKILIALSVSLFAVVMMTPTNIYAKEEAPAASESSGFKACEGNENSIICQNRNKEEGLDNRAKNLINTGLMIVGIASVIVIIVSGVLYIISAGDAGKVKRAKDTLMYAVVGLVISLLAYAIVNFVVDNIG